MFNPQGIRFALRPENQISTNRIIIDFNVTKKNPHFQNELKISYKNNAPYTVIERQTIRQTDNYTDRQRDGQIAKHTHRQTDRQTNTPLHTPPPTARGVGQRVLPKVRESSWRLRCFRRPPLQDL